MQFQIGDETKQSHINNHHAAHCTIELSSAPKPQIIFRNWTAAGRLIRIWKWTRKASFDKHFVFGSWKVSF